MVSDLELSQFDQMMSQHSHRALVLHMKFEIGVEILAGISESILNFVCFQSGHHGPLNKRLDVTMKKVEHLKLQISYASQNNELFENQRESCPRRTWSVGG